MSKVILAAFGSAPNASNICLNINEAQNHMQANAAHTCIPMLAYTAKYLATCTRGLMRVNTHGLGARRVRGYSVLSKTDEGFQNEVCTLCSMVGCSMAGGRCSMAGFSDGSLRDPLLM